MPKIAYLVNQYPKVSHTFIRREIVAIEAAGMEVLRYSIRPTNEDLVDQADKQEFNRTRFVLSAGPINLAKSDDHHSHTTPDPTCATITSSSQTRTSFKPRNIGSFGLRGRSLRSPDLV